MVSNNSKQNNNAEGSTALEHEVEKFSAIAKEWWSRNGKFKTLHDINPLRLKFITQNIFSAFKLTSLSKDVNILDIGCGGGLVSVPLAKMGAEVLGIDASSRNIEVAKQHLKNVGLEKSLVKNLSYKCSTIENLSVPAKFDVILALEVIEHVSDVQLFVEQALKRLKPNGLFIVSTINRTFKALMLAKIGAEYVLRWLPLGTHSWSKFVKPSELEQMVERCFSNTGYDTEIFSSTGMKYNLFQNTWYLDKSCLDVNYFMCFKLG